MPWYYLGLIFLLIGALEYFIDEYQQLVAVRLQIGKTILFATLNRFMDLVVDVFAFAILMQFWEQLKAGNYAIEILFPYLLYLLGCVIGTALALMFYKKYKRKLDQKKRLIHLEKARSIKKQIQALEDDLSTEFEIETEAEFDEEQVKEIRDATNEVHDKDKGQRPPVKKTGRNQNPPQ